MNTWNWCSVKKCPTNLCDKKPKTIFHQYPNDELRLNLWINATKCEYQGQQQKFYLQRVCSRHFQCTDYYKNVKTLRGLKKTAVPSLELYNGQTNDYIVKCEKLISNHNDGCKRNCIHKECSHNDGNSSCKFVKYPKEDVDTQRLWSQILRFPENKFNFEKGEYLCDCHFGNTNLCIQLERLDGWTNNQEESSLRKTRKRKKILPNNSNVCVSPKKLRSNSSIAKCNAKHNQLNETTVQDSSNSEIKKSSLINTNNGQITIAKIEPKIECAIKSCSVTSCNISGYNFFDFPQWSSTDSQVICHIVKKQFDAWLNCAPLKTNLSTKNLLICGKHFHLNKPAHLLNYCHSDWVPTKYLLTESDESTSVNEYLAYKENMGYWLFHDFEENLKETTLPKVQNITIEQDSMIQCDKSIQCIIPLKEEPIMLSNEAININNNKNHETLTTETIKIIQCSALSPTLKSKIQTLLDKKRKNGQNKYVSSIKQISSFYNNNHHQSICLQCNQKFDNNQTFYDHILTNNSCIKSLQNFCVLCEETLTSLDLFKDHLIQHTIKRSYFCTICNEIEYTSMIAQIDHHIIQQNKCEKYFCCNYCGYIDTNLCQLKMHRHLSRPLIINTTTPKTYACSMCERLFDNEIDYKFHQPYQCDKCLYCICNWNDFVQHVECIHAAAASQNYDEKCKFCPNLFNHRILLEYHQQTHRLIQCMICHKNFSCDLDLNEHINVVHDRTKQTDFIDNNYQCLDELNCTYCDDSFVTQIALNKHIEIEHSFNTDEQQEWPFTEIEENIINNSIDTFDNLMMENDNDEQERDDILPVFNEKNEQILQQAYCKMCNYVTDENDIINHIKTIHQICSICEIKFSTISECRKHMLLEHYS